MKQVSISLTDKEWQQIASALREFATMIDLDANDPDMEAASRKKVKQLAAELNDAAAVMEVLAN